jgi:hypothetical protein
LVLAGQKLKQHSHCSNTIFKATGTNFIPRHTTINQYYLNYRRTTGRSSKTGRVQNFHFSVASRPALGPTRPPIQRVQWALSSGREAEHNSN